MNSGMPSLYPGVVWFPILRPVSDYTEVGFILTVVAIFTCLRFLCLGSSSFRQAAQGNRSSDMTAEI